MNGDLFAAVEVETAPAPPEAWAQGEEDAVQEPPKANGAEEIAFVLGPEMVAHAIESQAGTVEKALLELVTNGIDAGAGKVEVEIRDGREITVVDDGCGLGSYDEVRKHMFTLGFDRSGADEQARNRVYGRFGIGRTQILVFGRAALRSGGHLVENDIRAWGYKGRLSQVEGQDVAGCRIDVELYTKLEVWEQAQAVDTLGLWLRYVGTEVRVQGRQVNRPPDGVEWTDRDGPVLFREDLDGDRGVDVYSQGVYVETMPHHRMGTSGVLTTVQGHPLKLNTARNDVLEAACPVWRRAKALLRSVADRRRKRGRLNTMDRQWVLEGLRHSPDVDGEYTEEKIVKTVSGRWVKPRHVMRHAKGVVVAAPSNHDQVGEQIHAHRMAVVLSPDMLAWTGTEDVAAWCKWFNRTFPRTYRWGPQTQPGDYAELATAFEGETTEIAPVAWSKAERAAMKGFAWMVWKVGVQMEDREPRQALLGESAQLEAWTDGRQVICIDRRVLRRQEVRGLQGWSHLYGLVVHEYAHDASTRDEHAHGGEFYERFHDFMLDGAEGAKTVVEALQRYYVGRGEQGLKRPARLRVNLEDALGGEAASEMLDGAA